MNLLMTKLYRPALPANPVRRPRLTRRLDDGLALGRQLTLISAPAGFGKSTCAAEWLERTAAPAVWLSLDEADNDPARFFAYVVVALQRVDEGMGAELAGVLRAGARPPAAAISTGLINDIAACGVRLLLVLDDFQTIHDPDILTAFEHLLANQPPNLHLVLLTREDPPLPLARLRANNQLTEIRAADLRFTTGEVAHFLNEVMALNLPPEGIAALEAKTEGWVAGLQLAGLSVRGRADAPAFIEALSGSHRYILSYLTEEVLNRQPAATRDFLLQTSILNRLSGPLCDAVTGGSGSADLLEALYTRNLFLIPLDDEGQWYRYHHLFADLLRSLYSVEAPADVAERHRRASEWYSRAAMPDAAIQHALDAADYELAGSLLDAYATDLIMQGYVQAVAGWLDALPAAVRARSPRAELASALLCLGRGDMRGAASHVQRLEAWFEQAEAAGEDRGLQAQWLALCSFIPSAEGRPAESIRLAERALTVAPEGDSTARGLAYHALATAHMFTGDALRVIELYRKAIHHAREAGNVSAAVQAASVLGQVALQIGAYHTAYEVLSGMVEQLERDEVLSPMSATLYAALGHVYLQWNRLHEARRCLERALRLCALGGYGDGEVYCRVQMSRLMLRERQPDAAAEQMQAAGVLLMAGAHPWVRHEAAAQQVRLDLAAGRAAEAAAALGEHGDYLQNGQVFPPLPADRPMTYDEALVSAAALAVWARLAAEGSDEDNLQRGVEAADALLDAAERVGLLPVALSAALLRAELYDALGQAALSRASVVRAVALAEPAGAVEPFLDAGAPAAAALAALLADGTLEAVESAFASLVLDAFPPGAAANPAANALLDPLTERELEILGLIADGCSNQEIADRLVLSHHTVKKHVSNLFSKMAVSRRTQAVALARELGLL